ncbi:haloacid dehalogenase type II [Quadrisphaera sp. DSM 44207]|uniref:haloacid dehalogenase type II n=1 Tax=Quadrisphaera sp. DSM 44207 TaxID=1881057 RepID=UPI000890D81B|nr:haloacid dehalogenase type II [Quadrisphaera sp. DSM 44207]SDQ89182.1 2-haloacid dehalogenase [Quadrisphaera sp. DSM 44207]
MTIPLPVRAVLFDVNETLSDTSALAGAFEGVGAPGHLAPTWFAAVLRDGFALTLAGASAPFADVARAVGRTVLAQAVAPERLDDAVQRVVAAVGELPLHPDVPGGLRALAGRGLRLATLTNGGAAVPRQLLAAAGLEGVVDRLLSVQDAPGGAWKPAASAYRHALGQLGVEPADAVLVAVHPWDVDGAHRAGLRTVFVDRAGTGHPAVFAAPDAVVSGVDELPAVLTAR